MRKKPENLDRQAPSPREYKSVWRSFRFAWDGLSYVLRTEKHMQFHVTIMSLVLMAAAGFGVNPYELLHLMTAFALVLITEMINTALERTIDLTVKTYDPSAKIAKDVAAGAVLLAAAYAVAVGIIGITTSETFWRVIRSLPESMATPHLGVVQGVLIGSILLGVIIAWLKAKTQSGTFWKGGVVSGHTALAFLIGTSLVIMTRNLSVACLVLAMALLVSQSRVQAKIHSMQEVVIGAALGTIMAIIIFFPFPSNG
ncbi:MAG: diacylglycerol kinase [Armatimonadetes bacterium]|jgi:diacylglycerol kinase (ATP)|nr:diacylglycerol kinase [Armatimonadota bacterium]MDI9586049.1 diacylglycerol kinase [Acidobacteriota bacterium]